jgi:pyruvate kinase
MEIPLEKVFIAQKTMIRKCNVAGKPVVTATQMLESMISNPRPTRAECSDVANAVLDGTDCVMLSGETANGQFPFAAVSTMARCCKEAEQMIDFDLTFNSLRKSAAAGEQPMCRQESLASSAVKTAHELKCTLIVAISETGRTARLVSKYFPQIPISVITTKPHVARQCSGYIGCCHSTIVPSVSDTETVIATSIRNLVEVGWIKVGDPVMCVYGTRAGEAGSVNMMKIMYVE